MKSTHSILIVLLLLQLALLSFICMSLPDRLAPELLREVTLLCTLVFLISAVSACLVSRSVLATYIEPNELTQSKLLSVLSYTGAPGEEKDLSLPALSEELVKEFESSRQRERLIAEFSSELLCSLNGERRFLELNVQAETLLAYPAFSLLANTIDSIVLQEDLSALISYFEKVKNESFSEVFECRVRKQSGELVDLEWQCEWSNKLQCYFCLARDISARKENQRLKSEIASMITHDLRAPVAGMSFLFENLEAGIFGEISERAKGEIANASESVEKMLALINQLMDAEKLEGGKMEADLRIVPLSEVYDHCNTLLSGLAKKKGLSLSFPESETMVFADYDQLNRILSNLISNAIKFSPANSAVRVEEELKTNTIKISVADSGPGVSEDLEPVIFERFKSRKTEGGGEQLASSGLGLYIAKKLTELQGGSIGLDTKPSKGARFWISLKQATEADLPDFE